MSALASPSPGAIEAVCFDLWETLITDTSALSHQQATLRVRRMEEILSAQGHAGLAGRIEEAYRAIWIRCQELYWSFDRDIPCRRQIEHFLEELSLDPHSFDDATLDALEDAYANAAVEIPPEPVEGAAETLAELRARRMKIGLISNTGRTPGSALRRILDRLGLSPAIDVMVFSNEHGECKPQTSIFEKLRAGLGVPYERMVFVGDNPYVDVHGAQRCGMRGVLFEPAVRGTAVAPPVDHGLEIVPDARVTSLRELVAVVDGWGSCVS
jgi:putative hydrolase of the HAD superfamily